MILDRESRKMLDLLISSEPDLPRRTFSYERICELSGKDPDDMFPIIKKLVSSGLAETGYAVTPSGKQHDRGIALSQDGRKYKEIGRLVRREQWKERIVGFVFGVLTSVAASLIIKLVTEYIIQSGIR